MIQLSVVIVNYNVKHFLEQALMSVQAAIRGLDAEVFVVDNNSVDGSVQMVREKFPWVKLIANKHNPGFSKGNNIAIEQARGEYVLLLNPDTVVEEDTFHKIVEFMDATPDAGALGVKMYNGEGEFLPESKRALPTPWVAFYKIFGLARLFPNSKKFGKYHLTYLDRDETHEIEVLSGAFMLLRKSVLDEIGLLDETFFMYGEDIDLSYRVTKAGYKNYYFPDTKIIHYKGESTRKGSLNYVLVFYKAMRIFAEKHFSSGKLSVYMFLIQLAIYFRAGLSIVKRVAQRIAFPALEFGLFAGAAFGFKEFWETYRNGWEYEPLYDKVLLGYAGVYVAYLWLSGAYKRPYKIRGVFLAVFLGFVTIATVNFLAKDINYSRAIPLLTSGGVLLTALLTRAVHNYARSGNFFLDERARRRVAIVGAPAEARRIARLLEKEILYNCEIAGYVAPDARSAGKEDMLGEAAQLDEIVRFYRLDEIVFCNKSLATQDIIGQISRLAGKNLAFKIAPKDADYLVGPGAVLSARRLQPQLANLQRAEYRVQKKLFDFVTSVGLTLLWPLTFWMYRRPGAALANLLEAVRGKYHLVGYIDGSQPGLPRLKKGVLNMRALAGADKRRSSLANARQLDHLYARNYSPALDLQILSRGFRDLGKKISA